MDGSRDVAPVLDPATRTAPIEIEIPNPGFRLKPGMYARVTVTTDERKDALVVPTNAVVDYTGRRGVFVAAGDSTVTFRPVRVGIEESEQIEILDGVAEGDRVVTTGAAALRDGDRVLLAGSSGGRRGATARHRTGADPSRARCQSGAAIPALHHRRPGADGISADRRSTTRRPARAADAAGSEDDADSSLQARHRRTQRPSVVRRLKPCALTRSLFHGDCR